MAPENHTLRLLKEILDEVRRSSEKSDVRFERMDAGLGLIETLKGLASETRAMMVALEHRTTVDRRLGEAERRLSELEKRVGH